VGPDFVQPADPAAKAYTPGGNPAATSTTEGAEVTVQNFKEGSEPDSRWWQRFGSSALDELVQLGLNNSPTVLAAQATLENARYTAAAERESLFVPNVSASLSDTREQFSTASIGQPGHHYLFNLANAQVGVTYNLDLFGGNRRQLESFMAQAEASGYLWQAARMSLASNMVTVAVREAGLNSQVALLKRQIALEQELLSIARSREQVGAISAMDVKTQEVNLANLAASLPPLEKQLNAYHHQLSVYLGRSPAEGVPQTIAFDSFKLPTDLPVLVPSSLVHRRPDILASSANLHQATAELGVATAAVYPNLSLSASYGVVGSRSADLFSSKGPVWSLGGSVLQPIFNGGALEASKNAAEARVRQAAFQYQATVLTAFQNVADSLRALESDANLEGSQRLSLKALESQWQAGQTQYQVGGIAYTTLLQMEERQLAAKSALIQTQTNRLCDTAALYLAMGGGWWEQDKSSREADKP
jgi:NodT family efflux transporter outer membrane factor (OMF) lipoprotein